MRRHPRAVVQLLEATITKIITVDPTGAAHVPEEFKGDLAVILEETRRGSPIRTVDFGLPYSPVVSEVFSKAESGFIHTNLLFLWPAALRALNGDDWHAYWTLIYYLAIVINSWFQYFDLDCRPWVSKLLGAVTNEADSISMEASEDLILVTMVLEEHILLNGDIPYFTKTFYDGHLALHILFSPRSSHGSVPECDLNCEQHTDLKLLEKLHTLLCDDRMTSSAAITEWLKEEFSTFHRSSTQATDDGRMIAQRMLLRRTVSSMYRSGAVKMLRETRNLLRVCLHFGYVYEDTGGSTILDYARIFGNRKAIKLTKVISKSAFIRISSRNQPLEAPCALQYVRPNASRPKTTMPWDIFDSSLYGPIELHVVHIPGYGRFADWSFDSPHLIGMLRRDIRLVRERRLLDHKLRTPDFNRCKIACSVDPARWRTDMEVISASGPLVVASVGYGGIMIIPQFRSQQFDIRQASSFGDGSSKVVLYFLDKNCRAGERYLAFFDVTLSLMNSGELVSTKRLYRILQVGPVVEGEQLIKDDSTIRRSLSGLNLVEVVGPSWFRPHILVHGTIAPIRADAEIVRFDRQLLDISKYKENVNVKMTRLVAAISAVCVPREVPATRTKKTTVDLQDQAKIGREKVKAVQVASLEERASNTLASLFALLRVGRNQEAITAKEAGIPTETLGTSQKKLDTDEQTS